MKQIAKSLVVVGAMLAAGTAAAEMMDDVKPYVGLDYYQAWMKGSKNDDQLSDLSYAELVPKSYPGASIYVGAKFTEYLGAELGSDFSLSKKKTTTGDLEDYPGMEASLTTKLRRNGMHIDFVGSLPVNDCFEILGFVGAGFVKVKGRAIVTVLGNIIDIGDFGKIRSKTTGVARLGLGASYMITDMIGLRAKLGWENTKRIKFDNNVKPFKDTTSLSVGAFLRW